MSDRLPLPAEWGALYAAAISETLKQEQHEAAHRLLQECLPQYAREYGISVPEAPPVLSFGKMGKPSFREYPELHFNLSHCSGLAVCLFSGVECGVDCESIRKYKPRTAQRVCTPQEIAALQTAENPDLLFTRFWTLKESYVKAIGIGISHPLHEVGFVIAGDSIVSNCSDASFMQFLLEDHIVSVCVLKKMEAQTVVKMEKFN